jgi:hypothetical protein
VLLVGLPRWEPSAAVELGTISSNKLEVIAPLFVLLQDLQGGGGKEGKTIPLLRRSFFTLR